MPRFTSPFDGAQLFHRDYQPNKTEYRCIAPDRRGFGNSDWNGPEPGMEQIDYNVFAQDTAHLLEKLDIGPFVFVAASMGPGRNTFSLRTQRIRSNSFAFAIRPIIQADDIRVHNSADLKTLLQRLMPLLLSDAFRLLQALDLTDRLQKLGTNADVPIMCVHGDQDLGCPYEASSKVIKEIIPRTNVKSVTTSQALTHTIALAKRLTKVQMGLWVRLKRYSQSIS
ncbi:hypothetical protein PABG_04675 [Paracoccidioides brasiliensis Pb03]|nr:hypothetical protein PABG_04675 [Paracoccidioides brasiliensis Pb03]